MSEEYAWAAGFIDGDGSTGGRVTVPQVEREPLDRLQAVLGGEVRAEYVAPRADGYVRRQQLRWVSGDAVETLRRLWPFLSSVKKAQALARQPSRAVPLGGILPDRNHEDSWAAGFFDAEAYYSGKSVEIKQVELEPLVRFQAALGVGRIGRPEMMGGRVVAADGYSRRPFYRYRTNRSETELLANRLRHLSVGVKFKETV